MSMMIVCLKHFNRINRGLRCLTANRVKRLHSKQGESRVNVSIDLQNVRRQFELSQTLAPKHLFIFSRVYTLLTFELSINCDRIGRGLFRLPIWQFQICSSFMLILRLIRLIHFDCAAIQVPNRLLSASLRRSLDLANESSSSDLRFTFGRHFSCFHLFSIVVMQLVNWTRIM
jgi:hypothetical protein